MEGNSLESDGLSSNFGDFINQVTKMSENTLIESDLTQVLDDFLLKLNECDKYLENGIFNMNFAEAALLLETSTKVYSKKVDLLWDIIFDYQKRLALAEDNDNQTEEIQRIEERKRKYKRKRRTILVETQSDKLVNNFSFGSDHPDYLNQALQPNNLMEEWQKFDLTAQSKSNTLRHLGFNKTPQFQPDSLIHTMDKDFIGRYNQFHATTVIEDIFHLEDQNLLQDNSDCVTAMRIDTYAINDYFAIKQEPGVQPPADLNSFLSSFTQHRQDKLQSADPLALKTFSHEPLQHLERLTPDEPIIRDLFVTLERLPLALVDNKLRRPSIADSMFDTAFDDDRMSSISEKLNAPIENNNTVSDLTFDQLAKAVDRNQSFSQDSAFFGSELDLDEPIDEESPIPEGSVFKVPVVQSPLCLGSGRIIPVVPRERRLVLKVARTKAPNSGMEARKKRISRKMLDKLSVGVTASLRNYERFFRMQYKASVDEGSVPPVELSDDEASDDDDTLPFRGFPEEESDDEDTPPFLGFEDAHRLNERLNPLDEDDDYNEPAEITEIEEEPPEDTPFLNSPPIENTQPSELASTSRLDENAEPLEESRQTVREWRSFIVPKINRMENKSDFDIHEYGSRILEPCEIGASTSFKDVVRDKSGAEVARYFIAALQLANTNNVEISGNACGEIANETFMLKVVDKTRHHELLEEYQAPSEETFRARFERVQALNPKMSMHSTPLSGPPPKKIKIQAITRKKLFHF